MIDYVNEDERYRLRGVTETSNEVYEISEDDIQAACDYLDNFIDGINTNIDELKL